MLMGLLVPGPSGNTNIVYYEVDGILLQSYLVLAIFKIELHAGMCELYKLNLPLEKQIRMLTKAK